VIFFLHIFSASRELVLRPPAGQGRSHFRGIQLPALDGRRFYHIMGQRFEVCFLLEFNPQGLHPADDLSFPAVAGFLPESGLGQAFFADFPSFI